MVIIRNLVMTGILKKIKKFATLGGLRKRRSGIFCLHLKISRHSIYKYSIPGAEKWVFRA